MGVVRELWRKYQPLAHQLARFGTVGVTNAAVDFSVYIILTRSSAFWMTHFLAANIIAGFLGNLNSFLWNRRWTFTHRGDGAMRQYLRFVGISAVYMVFIQLGVWWLVARLGVYDLLAKGLVLAVAVGIYFSILRLWVFRHR